MTLFDRLARVSGVAVDRVVGEPVRITPRTSLPRRPLANDDERPAVELVARFTLEPKTLEIDGQRRGTELGGFTLLQGAEAVLVISAGEADKLPYRLRQGDRVELLAASRAGAANWSVLTQLPSAPTLRVVTLTREN